MPSFLPFVVFSGTCLQALEFYKEVWEGEIISLKTYKDSPMQVPAEWEDRIFEAEFQSTFFQIKASDDLPNFPVKVGNNISLHVSLVDDSQRRKIFDQLSASGKVLFPLDDSFGMVKDSFGLQWMFAKGNQSAGRNG